MSSLPPPPPPCSPVQVRRRRVQTARRAVPCPMFYGCSWPEVVGLTADEAEKIIIQDKPELHVEVLSVNEMQTMAYHSLRVRLIVDRQNKVVETPHVG